MVSLVNRIFQRAPLVLRPFLAVVVVLCGVAVAQLAALAAYRLFGERRGMDFRLIGYLGACAGLAALGYGIGRSCLAQSSPGQPWLLGIITSAVFWSALVILAPSALRSGSDVVALILAIVAFGILGGFLLRSARRAP